MKRNIITLCGLLVLSLHLGAQEVTPDSTGMGQTAREWTKSIHMGWNLGNALESAGANWNNDSQTWTNTWVADYNEWETGWGNPKTTRSMIKAVKDVGFDAIRVPVRWVPHITDYTTMTVDPIWMARVKEVVDWCLAENLKVILNTHHELWLESNPFYEKKDTLDKSLGRLWTHIARTFRDYDSRLAFAGTNEVTVSWQMPTQENADVQNSYNQTFVDAVRATGGKNYYRQLIVQTYACDPSYGFLFFHVPEDKVKHHLSVEFHYYTPYSYCSGKEGSYYYWGQSYKDAGNICPDGDESSLTKLFAQARKQWFDKGLGVVVGEYGVAHHVTDDDKNTQEDNERYYLQCVSTAARKNGFAPFIWDNNNFTNGSESYGIFDRNNNMNVLQTYFLTGAKQGCEAEFDSIAAEDTTHDVGEGGQVCWNEDKALDWGMYVQLPASIFANFSDGTRLVLYYETDISADYHQLQLCSADWNKLPFIVDTMRFTGDFVPQNYYGYLLSNYITPITLTSASLVAAKSSGVIIQGHGFTLNKVVKTDAVTTINLPTRSQNHSRATYRLKGQCVKFIQKGVVYIRNNRKWIAQ